MAGETPDWRRLNAQAVAFPVTDLGELAARLGSIDTYDRRGDVVFLEDFESGLVRWTSSSSGVGGTVDLSVAGARSGLFSARLVAGSDVLRRAALALVVPTPALSLVGLEVSFSLHADTRFVRARLLYSDGTRRYDFEIGYATATEELQIMSSAGFRVAVASGVTVRSGPQVHSTMKMAVDLTNLRYVRGQLNRFGVDLSAQEAHDATSTTRDDVELLLEHYADSGTNPILYADDVILTQNEPL